MLHFEGCWQTIHCCLRQHFLSHSYSQSYPRLCWFTIQCHRLFTWHRLHLSTGTPGSENPHLFTRIVACLACALEVSIFITKVPNTFCSGGREYLYTHCKDVHSTHIPQMIARSQGGQFTLSLGHTDTGGFPTHPGYWLRRFNIANKSNLP